MPVSRKVLGGALAVVTLLGAAPGGAGAATKKPRPTCYPKKSATVDVNTVSRVYRRRETVPGTGGLRGLVFYGCDLKTKRKVRLADTDYYPADGVTVVLKGRYVAANYTLTDPAGIASGYLRVWDLRAHKRLHSMKDVGAEQMVLGPKGTLAWIGGPLPDEGVPAADPAVHLLDRTGDRAVAAGGVTPGSLAVAGATVYWTQNGLARSARLVP